MGIIFSGNNFILDDESEKKIVELSTNDVKDKHKDEYSLSLRRFREIVYLQEIANLKYFLESKHPEQVEQIYRLRAILNHERIK